MNESEKLRQLLSAEWEGVVPYTKNHYKLEVEDLCIVWRQSDNENGVIASIMNVTRKCTAEQAFEAFQKIFEIFKNMGL